MDRLRLEHRRALLAPLELFPLFPILLLAQVAPRARLVHHYAPVLVICAQRVRFKANLARCSANNAVNSPRPWLRVRVFATAMMATTITTITRVFHVLALLNVRGPTPRAQ